MLSIRTIEAGLCISFQNFNRAKEGLDLNLCKRQHQLFFHPVQLSDYYHYQLLELPRT
jgi:hypothetical protein